MNGGAPASARGSGRGNGGASAIDVAASRSGSGGATDVAAAGGAGSGGTGMGGSAVPEGTGGSTRDAGADAATDAGADAGSSLPPFPVTGDPLHTPDRVWTYVEFPETRCRDGSPAGVSLNLSGASKKVVLYLEGGVYCFDALTCGISPTNVDDTVFNSAKVAPMAGIFDLTNARNPVRDWNMVYVPYCTGDAMGGTRTTPTDVPGGPAQQWFTGRLNLEKFLQRIVPTFPDATDVLLTGISAGGSSVLNNAVLVQRAFARVRVRHVNDSSVPPFSKALFPECLQERWRTLWGLDQSTLADCGASCPNRNDFWRDNALFVARVFGDRPSGFIDSTEDVLMRIILGAGARNCTGSEFLDALAADAYHAELLDYRAKLAPYSSYATFIPTGTQHTWLKDAAFYTGSAGGTSLVEWFGKIANGNPAGNAGP